MNIYQELLDEMAVTKRGENILISHENAQRLIDFIEELKKMNKNIREFYQK